MSAETGKPGIQVPWTWLTFGLAAIAVAAVGTLAVIAGINNVDALSTIALALAVLAFSAQLIISLAQAQAGARQMEQIGRVNADTREALREIITTSQSLLENQRDIFSRVLHVALGSGAEVNDDLESSTGEDSDESDVNSPDTEASRLSAYSALTQLSEISGSLSPTPRIPTKRGSSLYERLKTPPDQQEGEAALSVLNTLTPFEIDRFSRIALEIRSAARAGKAPEARRVRRPGRPRSKPMESLIEKGLVSDSSGYGDEIRDEAVRVTYELTDSGISLARLLIATYGGELPEWLESSL